MVRLSHPREVATHHANGRVGLQLSCLVILVLGCLSAPSSSVFAQTAAGQRKILTEANEKDRLAEIQNPADKPIGQWAERITRQAAFPLVCRGGNGLTFDITERNGPGAMVRMRFRPGTGPSSEGLETGQCTWVDRGFQQGEPHQICHELHDFRILYGGKPDANVIVAFHNTSLQSHYQDYLGVLRLDQTLFVFYVFSDGKNCLNVVDAPVL
jgi:hypothetical protein